jgi:hypothetical protein
VNRPSASTRSIVGYIVLAQFLYLLGCDFTPTTLPLPHGTFSEVYSRFDPAAEFARLGCTVNAENVGGRISPQERYGWRPFQGSLQLPGDNAGCEFMAAAIRRALDRALGADCIDELTGPHERQRGQPLYGALRYESNGMRGHIFVWLFPNESESKINFAILLHEELLDGNSPRVIASF